MISVFAACSNEDDNIFNVNEPSQVVTDLVGTLKMDDNGKWNFVPDSRFSFPFMHGIYDGYSVQIVNWDSKYEDYKEGCLVQGKYKKKEYKSFGDGLGGISYYDLEISQIDKYDLPDEDNTRSSDEEVLPCVILNESEMSSMGTRATTSYVPIMDTFSLFRVNIFVHVVRSTAGIGLNKTTVRYNVLDVLSEFYDGTGIAFQCTGDEYIDSDAMNLINVSSCNTLFNRNPHTDAIDIYILSDGTNLGAAGATNSIGGTAIVSNEEYYSNYSTLAHEIGHALGLYHTHHGTAKNEYYEGGVAELVNGSNSQVAGDYVTDTPADPCVWSGSYGTDANGDSYKPDVTNMMCYNPNKNARKYITPGQLSRMNNCLMTNAESIKVRTVLSPYSVTGGKWINPSQQFTANFPDDYNVTWDVLCKRFSTTSSTNYTSMLKNYSGKSIEITNFDTSFKSQNYSIKAYGESSKGFKFLAQRTAYYLDISSETSTLRYSVSYNGITSENGTINISNPSNKVISVKQGGSLQFYFSDSCGLGDADVDMTLWMNGFSKALGVRNAFVCSTSAPLGLQNSPLNVVVGSKTKMLPLKVSVVQ